MAFSSDQPLKVSLLLLAVQKLPRVYLFKMYFDKGMENSKVALLLTCLQFIYTLKKELGRCKGRHCEGKTKIEQTRELGKNFNSVCEQKREELESWEPGRKFIVWREDVQAVT